MIKYKSALGTEINFGGSSSELSVRDSVIANLKCAVKPQSAVETARGVKRPVKAVWEAISELRDEGILEWEIEVIGGETFEGWVIAGSES
jgi:hypothetical protein